MGTPSDGKTFPPDKFCAQCKTILMGEEELEVGTCEDCQDEIATEIAQTSDQEHLLPLKPRE